MYLYDPQGSNLSQHGYRDHQKLRRDMIPAFPKIFALGTNYIKDIFKEPVEITEKVDGSQFVFGKVRGDLYMRSKGAVLYAENPEKMFSHAIDYVSQIQSCLPEGIIFYCEYLKNPKHNTLTYGRVPKNHLVLFGACNEYGEYLTNHADYASILNIEPIPVFYTGTIDSPEQIQKFMERESVLGGSNIEGVVIKNYSRSFLLGGQPIPLMMGKFVTESFKETHRERWSAEEKSSGKWASFLTSFRTEARWNKAIQHLRDSGKLEWTPRDIGSLIKEIQSDLANEEMESIKSYLWNENKREILSSATRGFPEWYKEQLLKSSFTNVTD